MHTLIPRYDGKRVFVDLTKVRTLRWEGYSYISRPNVIKSPYKRKVRIKIREVDQDYKSRGHSLSLSHTHTETLRDKDREIE